MVAVAVLLVGACGTVGEPSLVVSVSPQRIADERPVVVRVSAIAADGKVGAGSVRVSSPVGSLEGGATVPLDSFGTARVDFVCDPATTPACRDVMRITAEWTVKMETVTADATLNSGGAGTGGGSGGTGTGGGSGSGQPGDYSYETNASWRVTGTAPATGWEQAAFNDSGWGFAQVQSAAGTFPGVGAAIWDGPTTTSGSVQIWARKSFQVVGIVTTSTIDFACNDDMELYLNGVKVVDDTDGASTRKTITSVPLLQGTNVIAITCKDVVLPEHSLWGKHTIVTR